MLFISSLEITTEKAKELMTRARNPKMIQGVVIKDILGVFGKPDIILIFEAPSERTAAEFVLQFTDCAITRTHLVFPIKIIEGI
ncbi:MAG: GYD domain-containing protein [Candidatus Omnitrophica bacterium]|nr:GYD domain-containing protein [Candidatus Omnitrophota bacterium]